MGRTMCLTGGKARAYLEQLQTKWQQLQELPNVFAYKLNVKHRKYLPSEHWHFLSEYNPERSTLRRLPQTISSLYPVFDEQKFNFKKIQPEELLMNIPYADSVISMIINNSPLTRYHMLICPDIIAGHAQQITPVSLQFSVALLRDLDERAFRIGYNSPGALASLNHLHMHLMHIEAELYIDRVKLTPLCGSYVCRLSEEMPTEAICFVIPAFDSAQEVERKVQQLYEFIMWLCARNLAHNLFFTLNDCATELRIFVYARREYCVVKDLSTCNIAFCELSGYVPLGDQTLFDTLTEEQVIVKIRDITADAYAEIYSYFTKSK